MGSLFMGFTFFCFIIAWFHCKKVNFKEIIVKSNNTTIAGGHMGPPLQRREKTLNKDGVGEPLCGLPEKNRRDAFLGNQFKKRVNLKIKSKIQVTSHFRAPWSFCRRQNTPQAMDFYGHTRDAPTLSGKLIVLKKHFVPFVYRDITSSKR